MRIVRYDQFKGIEGLFVDQAPNPKPAKDQVVIKVYASCINPGSITALSGSPYVPIRDLAGEVVDIGDDVRDFAINDKVLGWVQDWGAHAEFVAVPVEQLAAKPDALSWDVAGSLYVTPMAGLAGVNAVAPKKQDTIVISGASGGVGFTSAQLAKRCGATIIGLASADNAPLLSRHGVIPVTYGDGQAERIRTAAEGRAIDGFIDTFSSGYVELAIKLGVPKERINTVVDYQAAQTENVKALGTREAGGIEAFKMLIELATAAELEIPIAATYALSDVRTAYTQLMARKGPGRIVLHPQE